jgi:hypothetical protein
MLLLLVAAVESIVARDRYNREASARPRTAVPELMKELYRYRGYARLSELYVIRDALIHIMFGFLSSSCAIQGLEHFSQLPALPGAETTVCASG